MTPSPFHPAQIQHTSDIYFYLVIIVIASIVVIAFAMILRKRLLSEGRDSGDGLFLMSDLRRMRDEGQISDEEYERARAAVIAKGKAMLADDEVETVDIVADIELPKADSLDESDNGDDADAKSE